MVSILYEHWRPILESIFLRERNEAPRPRGGGTYVRGGGRGFVRGFVGLRAGKCGSRPETECRYAG